MSGAAPMTKGNQVMEHPYITELHNLTAQDNLTLADLIDDSDVAWLEAPYEAPYLTPEPAEAWMTEQYWDDTDHWHSHRLVDGYFTPCIWCGVDWPLDFGEVGS